MSGTSTEDACRILPERLQDMPVMVEGATSQKILFLSMWTGLVAALCVAFIPHRTTLGLISIQVIVLLACCLSISRARRVKI
jgi:hypothetical protein